MATPARTITIMMCVACVVAGCTAPTATLDLITIALKASASASDAVDAQHAELITHLRRQLAALDSAFDADVRLAEGGQIPGPTSQPVKLTAQWVISARKGYAAARDLLAGQMRSAEISHAARVDNLRAGDEALEMASQLIVRQWSVGERIGRKILETHGRLVHGK